jgi:group I intron endonuclease
MLLKINTEPYGYIYLITNKINGKGYVGQSINHLNSSRWSSHIKGKQNTAISRAIKKYGKENFYFDIIDITAENQDELNSLEIYYIQKLNTFGFGYNMTTGGNYGQRSEETKRRQSVANTKFPNSIKPEVFSVLITNFFNFI